MSYQVLARKWRPQKFDEVVGQEHITTALATSIRLKQFGHAYIFSGTRGVGKTSLARIFAQAVRCAQPDREGNPCHKCPACQDFNTTSSLNVVEIDGASNNSVENVRNLIANAQYLPTVGAYKVYIIDEVHMLSVSAFNALLKTLEEPPAHVIFILATTAPEKLLDTVVSRCQCFEFRKVGLKDLKALVQKIAQAEKITFKEDRFIDAICQQGQGSVRDTLSLLEQVLSFAPKRIIDENAVAAALGLAKDSVVQELGEGIYNGDLVKVRSILKTAFAENVTAKNIFKALLDYFYRTIGEPAALEGALLAERLWIYEVLAQDAAWALGSLHPEQALEMILTKLAQRRSFFQDRPNPTTRNNTDNNTNTNTSFNPKVNTPSTNTMMSGNHGRSRDAQSASAEEEAASKSKEATIINHTAAPSTSSPGAPDTVGKPLSGQQKWQEFLAFVGDRSPSLRANLEQGNLLGPMMRTADQLSLKVGLGPTEKVFWEYLQDHDIHLKICRLLGEFFSLAPEQVDLKLSLLTAAQKQELNFRSLAEQGKEAVLRQEDSQEASLRNDPVIKEAEHLFHAEVDKVILANKAP
jgi:DNA polymerase-3 subunit gamma/tau